MTSAVHADFTPFIDVQIGWGGVYHPAKLIPATVSINWMSEKSEDGTTVLTDADASMPRNAYITLSTAQDSIYSTATTVPIVIIPGVSTSAVVYFRTSFELEEMEIELISERGRTLASLNANNTGIGLGTSRALANSYPMEADDLLILTAGDVSLQRAGWLWKRQPVEGIAVCAIDESQFPSSWEGYDCVSCVIFADTYNSLDATQILALRQWVYSGGDVVFLSTSGYDLFKRVFPDYASDISIGAWERFDIPDTIGVDFENALYELSCIDDNNEYQEGLIKYKTIDYEASCIQGPPYPQEDQSTTKAMDSHFLEPQINACRSQRTGVQTGYHRLYTLGNSLNAIGWKSIIAYNKSEEISHNPTGDMIQGSYGLGSITLLGYQPEVLARGFEPDVAAAAWWYSLKDVTALQIFAHKRSRNEDQANEYNSWLGKPDSSRMQSRLASNTMLEYLCQGHQSPSVMLLIVAGALGLLILMVGPMDRFIFKRLGKQPMTWLSCPIWVICVCTLIYFVENYFYLGEQTVKRVVAIDILPNQTMCNAYGITAMRSNNRAAFKLEGVGRAQYVSPIAFEYIYYYYSNSSPIGFPATLFQSGGQTQVSGLSVPLGGVRWQADRGRIPRPAIDVIVTELPNNVYHVVFDIPDDAIISGVQLSYLNISDTRVTQDYMYWLKSIQGKHWNATEAREGISLNFDNRIHEDLPKQDPYRYQYEAHIPMLDGHRIDRALFKEVTHQFQSERMLSFIQNQQQNSFGLQDSDIDSQQKLQWVMVIARIEGLTSDVSVKGYKPEIETTTIVRWLVPVIQKSE